MPQGESGSQHPKYVSIEYVKEIENETDWYIEITPVYTTGFDNGHVAISGGKLV